jgi:glutamate transport system permease protein
MSAGTLLAVMRVSPLPPLRWAGTAYISVARNTPLVLMFFIVVFALPELGMQVSFFIRAVIALSAYTASFVCEALRSGILTVDVGQAEAARALGMRFTQTIRLIILPQAWRACLPPLASTFIAMIKNTSVAEAFGLTEATGALDNLVRDHADAIWPIFLGIAAGYVLIVLAVSGGFRFLERRASVPA